MFSPSTLSFLSELQERSDAAYSEGGLLYTYVEASKQAHFRYSVDTISSLMLSPRELAELSRFLQGSHGKYTTQTAEPEFIVVAQLLIEHLQRDLRFNEYLAPLKTETTAWKPKLRCLAIQTIVSLS